MTGDLMDAGLAGGGFGVLSLVAMGFGCSSIVLFISRTIDRIKFFGSIEQFRSKCSIP